MDEYVYKGEGESRGKNCDKVVAVGSSLLAIFIAASIKLRSSNSYFFFSCS